MKRIFFLSLLVCASVFSHCQNEKLDSLLGALKNETKDSSIAKLRADISRQYLIISEYDKAEAYSNATLDKIEQLLAIPDISEASRRCILKAEGKTFNNLANVNMYRGDYDKSITYHLKALALREKIDDQPGISATYNNMGNVMLQKRDAAKSLEYYKRSITISEKLHDKYLLSMTYNNIGLIYEDKNDLDSGLIFLLKSQKLREELGDKHSIAASYNNIANIFRMRKEFKKAEEYCFLSIKMMEQEGDKMAMAVGYNNIGELYLTQHRLAEAKKMQLTSLALGKEINSKPTLLDTYASLARCDSALGDFKSAFEYRKLYGIISDSLYDEQSNQHIQEMQTKYDSEKKEHQIELLTKDGELQKTQVKTQKIISAAITLGLILAAAFAFFIFTRLRITRKQKLIIEDQKVVVDQKNKHITDSINYAKRIQDSILPAKDELSKYFSDYFILFRPRDIVSGDFYWYSHLSTPLPALPEGERAKAERLKHTDKAILVIADCTGHGVPGAFMSMIGNTLLNQIVNEQEITEPAEILSHLNEGIVKALHQESRSQDDGMDISVCLFDKEKNRITFAGANHSMYITHGDKIQEVKGDIYSIGSMFGKQNAAFTQQQITLENNSTLFFFTDGFPDQVGGEKRKKFMVKQLENLLLSISTLGIQEQEQAIVKTFDAWKGKNAQLDDVLLAAIRV